MIQLTPQEKEELKETGLNDLMIACTTGDIESAEQLLENEPELTNYFDPNFTYSPLVYALKANQPELIALLLSKNLRKSYCNTRRH